MRIFVFFATLILGVGIASIFKPSVPQIQCSDHSSNYRNVSLSREQINFGNRNFSQHEASELVGKRVRNLSNLSAKCPKDFGNCLSLNIGEKGEVIGVLPSMDDTYLIEIKWDNLPSDNRIEHSGSFVTRIGREASFEIIH
jgi:hypothetical protein